MFLFEDILVGFGQRPNVAEDGQGANCEGDRQCTRLSEVPRMLEHAVVNLFRGVVRLCCAPWGPISVPKYLARCPICICQKSVTLRVTQFLRPSHEVCPVLDPMTLAVVQVHACHLIDSFSCAGSRGENVLEGAGSQSVVVGVAKQSSARVTRKPQASDDHARCAPAAV